MPETHSAHSGRQLIFTLARIMKINLLLSFLFILLIAICRGGELTDTEIRSKLIGTWIVFRHLANFSIEGEITFSANGTLTSIEKITSQSGTKRSQFEATWEIKDGILIDTIIKHADATRVGIVTRDKIISISRGILTYQTENGNNVTRVRKDG